MFQVELNIWQKLPQTFGHKYGHSVVSRLWNSGYLLKTNGETCVFIFTCCSIGQGSHIESPSYSRQVLRANSTVTVEVAGGRFSATSHFLQFVVVRHQFEESCFYLCWITHQGTFRRKDRGTRFDLKYQYVNSCAIYFHQFAIVFCFNCSLLAET